MASERPHRSAEPPLLLVGLDHRTAPLELREHVATDGERTAEILVHLLSRPAVAEACLLSTCNRTEVYIVPPSANDEELAFAAARDLVFLDREPELARPGRLYVRRGDEAARHLLAVSCGLESMVLGEPEILGQVRQAASVAEAVGAAGTVLRRAFRSAADAGGRVRRETAIGHGAVSLGYATVELARSIFSELDELRVLLLGAGETARLVARSLLDRGVQKLVVANRSAERLQTFRAEFPNAEGIALADRHTALAQADLVVATTSADEPLLRRQDVEAAMRTRGGRPLLMVDLGVPRNVDAAAGRLGNVFLHTLDSLETLIHRNLKRRREEVPRAEAILNQELDHFHGWLRGLDAEPIVAELQRQAERIRQDELAAARSRFPPELHDELERLTRGLVRKILHAPSARLRHRRQSDSLPHLDLVRELFELDGGQSESTEKPTALEPRKPKADEP